MSKLGKHNVLGILVNAVDYQTAVEAILNAAQENRSFAATALAVHGVMTGIADTHHRYRLNSFDLVTPDGQPVRWALNLLYGTRLADRVYGPTLTLRICEEAALHSLPVYFYGSRQEILTSLTKNLRERFPKLIIAGSEPSKFRRTTPQEKSEIAERIRQSGARLVFIGLGCPRQEVFAFEYRSSLKMPMLAVGAAFDYHAGFLHEPPMRIQRLGLQWLYRLLQNPRRLWKRYLLLNCSFVALFLLQYLSVWNPKHTVGSPPAEDLLYG